MKINEDSAGPTNSAGGGAIAGIGIASTDPNAPKNFAEPGVRRSRKRPILTAKPVVRKGLQDFRTWFRDNGTK